MMKKISPVISRATAMMTRRTANAALARAVAANRAMSMMRKAIQMAKRTVPAKARQVRAAMAAMTVVKKAKSACRRLTYCPGNRQIGRKNGKKQRGAFRWI